MSKTMRMSNSLSSREAVNFPYHHTDIQVVVTLRTYIFDGIQKIVFMFEST